MSKHQDDLLARFAALAPEPLPGDWDEVLGRAGAPPKGRGLLVRSHARQGRRRFLFVLASAALVVVVGTATAFGIRALILDRGFIGLPPEGATPSAPETGELVLSLNGRIKTHVRKGEDPEGFGQPLDPVSRVWVYADGRMIWDREGEVSKGANELTSGLLEQRLTPEGVELLRSEIISSGLFDRDAAFVSKSGHSWIKFEVRNDDHLVRVYDVYPGGGAFGASDDFKKINPTTPTEEQAAALERVDALLTDPASWLPASAWDDQRIRAYVPTRYAACFAAFPQPLEADRILSLLPTPVERLLQGRSATRFEMGTNVAYCSGVTTEEARALAEALSGLGQKDEAVPPVRLGYSLDAPGEVGGTVGIWFEPYLPHGEYLPFASGR